MYYIIEIQRKADGTNNSTITGRSSLASGLSYYYERKSKMILNDSFVGVAVMLVDEHGSVIEQDDIVTQYSAE